MPGAFQIAILVTIRRRCRVARHVACPSSDAPAPHPELHGCASSPLCVTDLHTQYVMLIGTRPDNADYLWWGCGTTATHHY
jgi:hypothetical protein